ncbi:MAG: hypothetical protein ACAF41_23700 [Leptolyngbya sp. BL-A-14]
MNTSLSLLDRAKQGNAEAIAALMNEVLRPQDVWVKAVRDADCLQVMLKASEELHQATSIAFIRRGLLKLKPESIAQVRVYAWRTGDAFPQWIATFSLESLPDSHLHPMPTVLRQRNGSNGTGADRSPSAVPSPDNPSSLPLPSPAPTPPSTQLPKRRFELFKMGFVLVVATTVYFVVMGV